MPRHDVLFQAHSAAQDSSLRSQDAFPKKEMRCQPFVAFLVTFGDPRHRLQNCVCSFDNNRQATTNFLAGFLSAQLDTTTWGRPVGLLVLLDGSLLLTES